MSKCECPLLLSILVITIVANKKVALSALGQMGMKTVAHLTKG
jgi:hypothetical protein